MISNANALSCCARRSSLVCSCLAGLLLLMVGEMSFGRPAEVEAMSPAVQAKSDFPPMPLHPAKILIQLAVVGSLMVFWTFRPDPLRRMLQIGIAAEVLYAMLQDQLSVRLCPEYFTVAHPPIEALTDPTLLGLAWGFLGAWWGGALIGAVAGFAARLGSWPKLNPRELLLPFALLLILQTLATAVGGWIGTYEVTEPGFMIIEPLASYIPEARHHACFIVSRMHQGTYLSAVVGGLMICGWVLWQRWLLATMKAQVACPSTGG